MSQFLVLKKSAKAQEFLVLSPTARLSDIIMQIKSTKRHKNDTVLDLFWYI
jgi:hypothetical protein